MSILRRNRRNGPIPWSLKDFLERQGERLLRSGPEWRMSSDHSITIRGELDGTTTAPLAKAGRPLIS